MSNELAASCLYASAALTYLAAAEIARGKYLKRNGKHKRRIEQIEDPIEHASTNKPKKTSKRIWAKFDRPRYEEDNIHQLLKDYLLLHDDLTRDSHLQLTEDSFLKLLSYIQNIISKKDTLLRAAIPATEKLAVALRLLAISETRKDLIANTKMSNTYLDLAIPEVCNAICANLEKEYLQFPSTVERWQDIVNGFQSMWQFPCCLGSLGIFHVPYLAPHKSRKSYTNSMGFTSIILLGLVDAHGRFMYIDIGCNGRASGEEALDKSGLMELLCQEKSNLPGPQQEVHGFNLPSVFIGDESLPLTTQLLTPYHEPSYDIQNVYNWRLSRANQSIAKAFDVMSSRFGILKKLTHIQEKNLKLFIKCCCILHNFFIANSPEYLKAYMIEEYSKKHKRLSTSVANDEARNVRDTFAWYFLNSSNSYYNM